MRMGNPPLERALVWLLLHFGLCLKRLAYGVDFVCQRGAQVQNRAVYMRPSLRPLRPSPVAETA